MVAFTRSHGKIRVITVRSASKKERKAYEEKKKENHKEITNYDNNDTTQWIDKDNPLTLEDLRFKLPDVPPTQVISIRLSTELVNQIRVLGLK